MHSINRQSLLITALLPSSPFLLFGLFRCFLFLWCLFALFPFRFLLSRSRRLIISLLLLSPPSLLSISISIPSIITSFGSLIIPFVFPPLVLFFLPPFFCCSCRNRIPM